MFDIVQIAGALLVLVCFLLAQVNRIDPTASHYLVPNLVGSGVLCGTAVVGHEWGFVFLEGIWALVSAWGLAQRLRGRRPEVAH